MNNLLFQPVSGLSGGVIDGAASPSGHSVRAVVL